MTENNNTLPKRKKLKTFILIIALIVFAGVIIFLGFFAKSASPVNYLLNDTPVVKNIMSRAKQKLFVDESGEQENQLEEQRASLNELADQLQNMEDTLDKKEEELNNRGIDLTKKETNLKIQQAKLNAQYDNMRKLSSVYSKMDPNAAAGSLNKLNDNNLAAQILKNMGTDKAGAILSNMDPGQAAAITKVLAPQETPQE
jgi:flagellar motility protein MotE (MotC chaperone)